MRSFWIGSLLFGLVSSATHASNEPDKRCQLSFRQIAQAKAMALGNGPTPAIYSPRPKIVTTPDGGYEITVYPSADGPGEFIRFIPVKRGNPSLGFRVLTQDLATRKTTETFSRTPPKTIRSIRRDNRARQADDQVDLMARTLIASRLRFYQIPENRMKECQEIVKKRKSHLNDVDSALLSFHYALATHPSAVQFIATGAMERGHSPEKVARLLRGEEQDLQTVASENDRCYVETIDAVKTLNRNGFDEVANPVIQSALTFLGSSTTSPSLGR